MIALKAINRINNVEWRLFIGFYQKPINNKTQFASKDQ
jgi:hypothetical protein